MASLSEVLSWFEDPEEGAESDVAESLVDLWLMNAELGERVAGLSWIEDGLDILEGGVLEGILRVSRVDPVLAEQLMSYFWVMDAPTEEEKVVIGAFADIASGDADLAGQIASLSWVEDGVNSIEANALEELPEVAAVEASLVSAMLSFPWIADDVTEEEGVVIHSIAVMGSIDAELARKVASLSWLADGVTEHESDVFQAFSYVATENLEIAREIASLFWLNDRVFDSTDRTIYILFGIAEEDRELGRRVMSLTWVNGFLTNALSRVLQDISSIASDDVEFAEGIVSIPWFSEGLTYNSERIPGILREMAHPEDKNLSRLVIALPWLHDDITSHEISALRSVVDLMYEDRELAEIVAALPWLSDDITEEESATLQELVTVASDNVELARELATLTLLTERATEDTSAVIGIFSDLTFIDEDLSQQVKSLPWFTDGLTEVERNSIDVLIGIAHLDTELAKSAASLPWFADDIDEVEFEAINNLVDIAIRDLDLAKTLIGFPWLVDGVTKLEASALYSLGDTSYEDLELARDVINWPRYENGVERDLDFFLLWALGRADEELLDTLKARTWFTDGVTDEEAALIVTMAGQEPSLYKELLIDSHLYHESISLPLAGDINVWLVQDTSPVLNQESLRQIESAAQIAEEFFGVPFPTTDLIVLLVTEGKREYGHLVRHLGSHMSVIVHRGRLFGIPHEAAHYYLTSNFLGHPWFTEGGANFVEAHVNHERGWQDISSRETVVSKEVQSYCVDSGVENIRHNAYLLDRRQISLFQCTYRLGEYLMLRLLKIMGKNAMSSALNELYVSSGGHLPALRFSTPPSEEEIYGAFLKHAPSQQDKIQKLFQKLHGGDFAFSEIDTVDEEADSAEGAMHVDIGEAATGSLDYIFDFDFFKFEAKEGQIYRISLEHETLSHTSFTLYGPDGETELRNQWQGRIMGPDGPLIQWRAPSSESYFLAVQNFGGKTGEYTFTITPVDEPETDDHGNGVESATRVGRFKEIHGTIDGTFDEDYFRFSAHEGRVYHIFMWPEQTVDLCAQMYRADGSRSTEWHNRCDHGSLWAGGRVHGAIWVAPETGDFYLAMSGFMESVGDYKFEIILALDPGNPS